MNQIQNDFLKVKIKCAGAEVCSIINKKDDFEFIWIGDEKIWSRNAPVLFPYVGKLNNNSIKINEKFYQLPQHGFARDFDFEVLNFNEIEIIFQLLYSEKTLLNYPYKFNFQIKYRLEVNALIVDYKIENLDEIKLYYSIGAHPGFMLPSENLDEYVIEFSGENNVLERQLLSNGLFNYQAETIKLSDRKLKLENSIFDRDALVFFDDKNDWLKLSHLNSNYSIKLYYSQFDSLGIWSKPNCYKFVCLEPWLGHADFEDFDGDISEKKGILSLLPFEKAIHSYTLVFNH